MIPPDRRLDLDIVSHSRGGLVARAIADVAASADSPPQVRSTVFVAARTVAHRWPTTNTSRPSSTG